MKEILFGNGAKYTGEVKDGKLEGKGTYTFLDGSIYIGDFKEDKEQGYGLLTYPNGKKYEGEFKEGKFSGNGTLTYPDGTIHIGEFEDGVFNGKGKVIYKDGEIYEGIFEDGKRKKGVFKNPNDNDKNSVSNIVNLTFSNGNTYLGGYKDGKLSGQGTYTFSSGAIYVGEFKDGLRNGKGIVTYSNGTKYEGEFKDDKLCGNGTYTFSDDTIYCGEFKDGQANGQGVRIYSNGAKYEGDFKDGVCCGKGTYTYGDGRIYIGDFKDDVENGKGVKKYPNGDKYEGDFKNGKSCGKGIYTYSDGTIYDGEFKNDDYNGEGILTHSNIERYEGNFKKGVYFGQGTYNYSDGTIYKGEFKNGEENGKGLKKYSNGDKYDGDFKNDKLCGKGIYTFSSGTIYTGEFKDDEENGKGIIKYSNGDKYEGDFKNGKLCGKGIYTFSSGTIYIGEFKDGLRNGKGIQTSSNGDNYDGEFNDGKFCGKGIHKKANGEIYNGDFKNGQYNGIGSLINSFDEKYNGEFADGKYNGIGTLISSNGKKYSGEFKDGSYVPKDTNSINYKKDVSKQEVHFKNIQSKISELLDTAKFDVKIAVAWFTDKHLITTLKKLAKEGVNITIIIYDDKINNKDLFEELYHLNCKVYLSRKLMHNKFCVIDNDIVINGSYNWTYSAHSNSENITVTFGNVEFTGNFVIEFDELSKRCILIDSYFADYAKSASIVNQLIEEKIEEIKVKKTHLNFFYPFFYRVNDGVFFVENENIFKRLIMIYELTKIVDYDSLNKKLKAEIQDENSTFRYFYKSENNPRCAFYYDIADIEFDDDNMAPFFPQQYHLAIIKYGTAFKVFNIDKNNRRLSKERIFNIRINVFFVYQSFAQKYKEPKEEWHLFYSKKLESLFEIEKGNYTILESIIILTEKRHSSIRSFKIIDFDGIKINDINYNECKILEDRIELRLSPSQKFNIIRGNTLGQYYGKDYRIDTFNFKGKVLSKKYFYDETNRYQNLIVNVYSDDLKRFENMYCHINKEKLDIQLYFLELLIIYNYMDSGYQTFINVLNSNPISLLKYVENEIKNDKKLYSLAKSRHIIIKKEAEPFCYIATMAYGNINHPKVQNFRDFRDNYLSKTVLGNVFIKYYYNYSPGWVKFLKPHKTINKIIRFGLDILNYFIPKS